MTASNDEPFPEMMARKLFMELSTIPYVRRSTSRNTSGSGSGTQPIVVATSEPSRASATSPREQRIVASWDQLGKVQKHIVIHVTEDNGVEVMLAPRPELSTQHNADFESGETANAQSRNTSAGNPPSEPNLRPQVAHSPDST